jgi:hypothetical protein
MQTSQKHLKEDDDGDVFLPESSSGRVVGGMRVNVKGF